MKLKTDEAGHAVLKDGHPVYVHEDGKEIAHDAAGTVATIGRLNAEAKGHRERAEDAARRLKAFEGIEDPAAARLALETMSKLDQKKLLDAGEVDKVREAAKKAFDEQVRAIEDKYSPIVKERDTLQGQLVAANVGNAFSNSKYIADKMAVPADIVQARFGTNFKYEDGKVVAFDKDGNKLFSRAQPGNIAEFDEALEILVDGYPYKEHILKGSGANGGGSGGGGKGGKSGMTRTQYDNLSPMEQRAHIKGGGTVADV